MDKETTVWTLEEQDLFEKYLLGTMEVHEKAALESRLQSEPVLNDKFLEFKRMFSAIEEAGLRSKLQDFHRDWDNNGKVKTFHLRKHRTFLWAAATIALLIALGGIWQLFVSNSNEKLFNEYFTPDPGLPTVMGNTDNYDFYEAMVDYKQGNYGAALQKWGDQLPGKMDNDTLNYFIGSAYLANGEADKAIPCFDRVLISDQPSFKNEAAFYLGLAHLKKNEVEAAIKSLEQSADEKGRALAKKLKH